MCQKSLQFRDLCMTFRSKALMSYCSRDTMNNALITTYLAPFIWHLFPYCKMAFDIVCPYDLYMTFIGEPHDLYAAMPVYPVILYTYTAVTSCHCDRQLDDLYDLYAIIS